MRISILRDKKRKQRGGKKKRRGVIIMRGGTIKESVEKCKQYYLEQASDLVSNFNRRLILMWLFGSRRASRVGLHPCIPVM